MPVARGPNVRRCRGRSATSTIAWTLLFLLLLNVAAVAVFDPARDPLAFDSDMSDDALTHFGVFGPAEVAVAGGAFLVAIGRADA